MHFIVRWPDGAETRCYSPSLVVRDYLDVGRVYPLGDFMERSRTMLHIGSERVRAKFGYACSSALDQLRELETQAATCDQSGSVTVVAFELPEGLTPGGGAPTALDTGIKRV
jgi:uncharacterized repeat protein (TIGR04042 family)